MGVNPRNFHFVKPVPTYIQLIGLSVFVAAVFGINELDNLERDRMVKFRDKSAMYGGLKGPDDEPSWGRKGYDFRYTDRYKRQREGR